MRNLLQNIVIIEVQSLKKYSKRLMVLLSILLTGLSAGDLYAQSDEDCRLCHLDQGRLSLTALRDTVSAFIDMPVYNQSVHYLAGFECIDCHSDITDIPHAKITLYL